MVNNKILLLVLSDQHIPNFLSVKRFDPDTVYIFQTKAMQEKGVLKNFEKALNVHPSCLSIKEIFIERDINDIESMTYLINKLNSIYMNNKESEWIVNLTGGTKLISILLYQFFQDKNLKLIYMAINSNYFIDLKKKEKIGIEYKINIDEFLAGYGISITGLNTSNPQDIWKKLSIILVKNARNNDIENFLSGIYGIKQINDKQKKMFHEGSKLTINLNDNIQIHSNPDNIIDIITKDPFHLILKQNNITGTLSEKSALYFTGGWLEYFVASLLYEVKDELDLHDITKNLKIQLPNGTENEIDIAFMHNQTLHIVECKTGSQANDRSGDNTLYKMEAIKESMSAIKIKSYLVTTSFNIYNKNNISIKDNVTKRALSYDITIISPIDIIKLAEEFNDKQQLIQNCRKIFKI